MAKTSQEVSLKAGIPMDHFISVEFSTTGHIYQFKIWNMAPPESMCVLIREDSEILASLKVGDKLLMKYYTADSLCPIKDLETKIRHIRKKDRGRFKGHFVVGLKILGNGDPKKAH